MSDLAIYNTTNSKNGILIPAVPSWRNLILAPDIGNCYFSLDKSSNSKDLNVEGGSITGQATIEKKSTNELIELVYTTSLSLIDLNQSLYTKVITIMPKYVIINNSDEKLLVTQENLLDDFIIIDSKSREFFKWLNAKATKKIMIKILDSKADDPINEWHWSSPIILEEIGSSSVRCPSTTRQDVFLYWKIDRRIQNDIIFITINKESENHPLYAIENNTENVVLMYKQSKGQIIEFCKPKENKRFAWDDLYNDHHLVVDVLLSNSANTKISTVKIKIDKMEQNEKINYKTKGGEGTIYENSVYYYTYTDGYTKKLVFDDRGRDKQDKESEDHTPHLMLNLELGGMGISLINSANDKTLDIRKEILFISITDIQGI